MSGATETKTKRRAGASQFDDLLKGEQAKYKQYSGYYPEWLTESEDLRTSGDMYITDPGFQRTMEGVLGGMKERGYQTLSDYYEPQYRSNSQDVAGRFGGIQSSVARDTSAEIAKREKDAVANLAQQIEQQRYNIEGTQLQRQRQPFTDVLGRMQTADALTPQYSNIIGQAQAYAPINYQVPKKSFYDKHTLGGWAGIPPEVALGALSGGLGAVGGIGAGATGGQAARQIGQGMLKGAIGGYQ